MAVGQAVQTTTNSATIAQLHLPPPQTFDILPPLHELLARVDAYHSTNTSVLQADTLEDHHTLEDGSTDIGSAYTGLQPLNPKDLPTATLEVKARIRNALREVEKLPDVDRTIEEQDEEIEELEIRIKKQREMLKGLAEVAKRVEGKV